MDASKPVISPLFRDAFITGLKIQLLLAMLSLMILDSGRTAKICGLSLLGFWIVAALIALQRPWTPTRGDLLFWRWGFVPAFALGIVSAMIFVPF
ncbi:MAG: hypothetical protein WEB58_03590 [Planctomycetaceae bacterium]